jgi:carbamate kinase
MPEPLMVIAVGGNSLIKDASHMGVVDQYRAAGETAEHIVDIIELGYRLVITHGNGPQVGFILLRSEIARDQLHEVPLESCVADTQGAIGYQIAQTMTNELGRRGTQCKIVAIVTQVVVDPDDPAFKSPTKPIGPFFSEEEAMLRQENAGWDVMEDSGRGWRRAIASPRPLAIVEEPAIKTLVDNGFIVIAVGGGGIPVCMDDDGAMRGLPAVIDKDAASSLLAKDLGAEILLISTAVEKVALNFGKPNETTIGVMTVAQARKYMAEGHFAPGSMQPKIQAGINFLVTGGRRVIITKPELLRKAVEGKTGTHIVP